MNMNSIVIAANLGHLKAYRVEETPNRGQKLQLIEDIEFPEAHGRFIDKVTDLAGRFPVSSGAHPGVQMAHAETLTVDLEVERRLVRLVCEQIESHTADATSWYFAANNEIQRAVLDNLKRPTREKLVRAVACDLTKAPAAEVQDHFKGFMAR
jgi:hypothetical protein